MAQVNKCLVPYSVLTVDQDNLHWPINAYRFVLFAPSRPPLKRTFIAWHYLVFYSSPDE